MTIRKILSTILLMGAVVALFQLSALAQTVPGASSTSTLSVTIGPEAAIVINTSSSTLATNGNAFASDFIGATSYTYKIRTSKTGGTGNIGVQVTSDFSPGSGPSVASPPTAGDTLSYTCAATAPATACTGSQTASTTASTPVATFGADAHSAKGGNIGSVNWDLTNDPKYGTGTYTATVTFTISAA
jgi:hypothetical protein